MEALANLTSKQLSALLKEKKEEEKLLNSTTLQEEVEAKLNDIKDTKQGAIELKAIIKEMFLDARYSEKKAISSHKTKAEKMENADDYYWCGHHKKENGGDVCGKAKATAKGLHSHMLKCRHNGNPLSDKCVKSEENIGTKKEPKMVEISYLKSIE